MCHKTQSFLDTSGEPVRQGVQSFRGRTAAIMRAHNLAQRNSVATAIDTSNQDEVLDNPDGFGEHGVAIEFGRWKPISGHSLHASSCTACANDSVVFPSRCGVFPTVQIAMSMTMNAASWQAKLYYPIVLTGFGMSRLTGKSQGGRTRDRDMLPVRPNCEDLRCEYQQSLRRADFFAFGCLKDGASSEGVAFAGERFVVRPVVALSEDAYLRSICRFSSGLTGRAKSLIAARASLVLKKRSNGCF